MPRPRRHATAVTTQPAPALPARGQPVDGVDRLRALVKARREGQAPTRPGFRERLEAWLEQEL